MKVRVRNNFKRELNTDEQRTVENIAGKIGTDQVTRRKLEFAPSWIVEEALDQEFRANWENSYIPILLVCINYP